MNTMEALGNGPALAPKGEVPGLNLGADAETLALFASLFAMMQTQQSDGADSTATSSEGPAPQLQHGTRDGKSLLPAAAMLMAGLAPSTGLANTNLSGSDNAAKVSTSGDGVSGDAAGLLKLLLAAHDIATPDRRPATEASESDAGIAHAMTPGITPGIASGIAPGITPGAPARTATEMLNGAIEILKSLEASPVKKGLDIPGASDKVMPRVPMPIVDPAPSAEFIDTMPMVKPAPSAEFIGPMPMASSSMTASPTMPAPVMVLLAEPEFIGPMPAVTTRLPATQAPTPGSPAPAFVVLSDPDFIGLLPEADSPAELPLSAVMLHADPDFVGPMPTVIQTTATMQAAVTTTIAPPSPDFVGPMPAIRSIVTAAHDSPDVMATLPDAAMDDTVQAKEESFVHRRAFVQATGRGVSEKTADQKMAADIQATRMAALRAGAETAQGSSASTSAPVLAQQIASSLTNSQGAAVNAQDMSQTATANTTTNTPGGQNGSQSGGHSGNQSGAQQMADGGMSRGSADRTLLHRLNTDNAGWSETMVKRLTADLRSGVQNVRIILEPRQLGKLNVELGLRNGQASIRIAAETQEAAKLLSAARGQLGHMLESAGLRLAGFQATGSQAGDAGLDSGQGSQGRGGDAAGDHDARNKTGRNQEFSNKIATTLDETADDVMTGEGALRKGETAVLSILA